MAATIKVRLLDIIGTQNSSNRLLRTGTWIVLLWEKLWPPLVPLFMLVSAILVFTWTGGWRYLDQEGVQVLLWPARIATAAGILACLWPLKNLVLPTQNEIVRRIEQKSALVDRPMTAQHDPIAMGDKDGFAAVLWHEHQQRMASRLDNMTAGAPSPKANRFDPYAIRAILPLLAFAAFFYSFSSNGGQISDFYGGHKQRADILTRMDAWINPPAYTQKPPVYLTLNKDGMTANNLTVPQGSEFFLRFVGNTGLKVIRSGKSGESSINPQSESTDGEEIEYVFDLAENSTVRLLHGNSELARWVVSLVADTPPEILFDEHPSSALSGSLQLSYSVKDDYGVVRAAAEIKSLEPVDPDARPLIEPPKLELPLPRQRAKSGKSKVNRDLTRHPWAGSKVTINLTATDDAGQTGKSESREITLPGRRFSKPLALALVEQRRILAMDANKQRHVADLLDAVSTGPEEYINNTNAFLGMRVAYRRIVDAQGDDDLRSALDLLWEVALAVEFGDLSEAERRLREAQEALSEALEKGSTPEEIDKLMKELRQAMNEMMQALAEQARKNPQNQNPFNPADQAQILTQNDLQKMMDRIEDLAKSGSEDAARQLLNEMQRMMDNLRAGRHERQRQAEGNQLNKSLDKLSELMQRQQELMNETYRMQREHQQGFANPDNRQGERQQGRNQQGEQQGQSRQGQNRPGENGGQMTEQEFADALKRLQKQQEALQQQLGELGKQLEGLGMEPSEELNEARRQMGEAGKNLGQGETGPAATNQGQALEALRQGAQSMMQQMAGDRQQGGEQQSQTGDQGIGDSQRSNDPLGRTTKNNNLYDNSNENIPGEIDVQRVRRILDAIRKRLSTPDNPLIEQDYLERLLKSR